MYERINVKTRRANIADFAGEGAGGGGGGSGTRNYNDLSNKPRVSTDKGSAELQGNVNIKTTLKVLTDTDKEVLEDYIETKGSHIQLTYDQTTEKLNAYLKDENNNTISSSSIDLILEGLVVGGEYNATNKTIELTLKDVATPIVIPVGDLVDGLLSETKQANKIYGTDDVGNQKLYNADDLGKVKDIKVDGVSIIDSTNKEANMITDTEAIDNMFDDLPDVNPFKLSDVVSDNTPYSDNPAETDTLSNFDIANAKVKKITFANLFKWIKSKLVGAISTVLTDNLTASRAVITNTSGKLIVAAAIPAQTTLAIYPQKLSATGLTSEVGTGQAITSEYKSSANNQLFSRNGANTMWKQNTKLVGFFNRNSSQSFTMNAWSNISLTGSSDTDSSFATLASNGIKILKTGVYRFDITTRMTDSISSDTFVEWAVGLTGHDDDSLGGGWFCTRHRHKITTSVFAYITANSIVYPRIYSTGGLNQINYCNVVVSCIKES